MTGRILVLNRNFQPIHITNVKRAFSLLYVGTAQALGPNFALFDFQKWSSLPVLDGEKFIHTVQKKIMVPQIIILQMYDRLPKTQIRLSRANVYARDQYQCQYCEKRPDRTQLNLDHVTPRSRGGKTSWENIVCCCLTCNLKKANRTPSEAGMRLLRIPQKPRFHPQFRFQGACPEAWEPFFETTFSLSL